MARGRTGGRELAARLPHTRGDGPRARFPGRRLRRTSPHPWGWPAPFRPPPPRFLDFPTPVGMARPLKTHCLPVAGLPHTRGDGPRLFGLRRRAFWTSPHPWGWPEAALSGEAKPEDFPTPVGMARAASSVSMSILGLPHTRGDGPAVKNALLASCGTSPHPWGWPGLHPGHAGARQDFPTPVGMARPRARAASRPCRLPHTRGDGPRARSSG